MRQQSHHGIVPEEFAMILGIHGRGSSVGFSGRGSQRKRERIKLLSKTLIAANTDECGDFATPVSFFAMASP
jgi:hypothetical protein